MQTSPRRVNDTPSEITVRKVQARMHVQAHAQTLTQPPSVAAKRVTIMMRHVVFVGGRSLWR